MPEADHQRPREDDPEALDKSDEGAVVREYRRALYSYSFIGIEFGVAVALGYFGGAWLDGQLDTTPWFMLLGVGLGMTAATMDLFRLVRRARRRAAQQDEADASGPDD